MGNLEVGSGLPTQSEIRNGISIFCSFFVCFLFVFFIGRTEKIEMDSFDWVGKTPPPPPATASLDVHRLFGSKKKLHDGSF